MIKIATFDFGKKNFAFYVEEVSTDNLDKNIKIYKKLPKSLQRKVKGQMNDEIENILNDLYLNSKRIEMGVFDIRDNKESNDLDFQTRINMHTLLESKADVWDECDIIVLEQQYFAMPSGNGGRKTHSNKGFGINLDAIKLAECCLNWFLIKYATFKEIVFFGSMYKTETLGAPSKQTKPQRKKWSIEKAIEILNLRGDNEGLEELKNMKNSLGKKQKMDDIADCITMCQAYKFRKLISNI